MHKPKLTVVFDETGGSSRPLDQDEVGFGVGAILFPEQCQAGLVSAARAIAQAVENADFKYKHVQRDTEARKLFIKAMGAFGDALSVYGFFSARAGVARGIDRTSEAGEYYGTAHTHAPASKSSTEHLLDRFLGYMVPQVCWHAHTVGYCSEVYWDKRTDFAFLDDRMKFYIEECKTQPEFGGNESFMHFAGPATGDFHAVSRLAGVLAGDIRKFFNRHGPRIWQHFDQGGLRGDFDPYLEGRPEHDYNTLMATITDPLADPDPFIASTDTVMLGGYYKRFLKNWTGQRLISFSDPEGRFGVIGIEHGQRWHIYQLPD